MGLFLCRLWINAIAPLNTSQRALQNHRAKSASERQPSSQKNSTGQSSLRSRTKMLQKQNAVDHHFMNGKKPKERKISKCQKKTQPLSKGSSDIFDGDGLPACSIASNMKEQQELPLSLRKILKKPPQRFHSGFQAHTPAFSPISSNKCQPNTKIEDSRIQCDWLANSFGAHTQAFSPISPNKCQSNTKTEDSGIQRNWLCKSLHMTSNGNVQWSPRATFAGMKTSRLVSKNLQKPLIAWLNRDNTPVVKAKDTQADEVDSRIAIFKGPDRVTQAALLFKCSAEKWAQLWYDGEKPVLEKLNSETDYDEDKLFTCHKTDGYYAFRCEHFYVNVDPTRGELGLGGLASKSLFNLDMSIDIPSETFPQEK